MAKGISEEFNDEKFARLYEIEEQLADALIEAVEWHDQWSQDLAKYKSDNNPIGVDNAGSMVEYWEDRTVRVVAKVAEYKANLEASQKPANIEFRQRNLTTLGDVYEALSKLSDTDIQDGKKLLAVLKPLTVVVEEEAQPPSPLTKNPFKKGPQ